MRTEVIAWAIVALVLIAAEVVAPGVFLLWFGIAAGVVFAVVLLVPGIPPVFQALGFVVLAFASVFAYRRFFRKADEQSDQPLLNRRSVQFVGKRFVLATPIVNGFGQIRVGDAFWTVTGPELPAGATVLVTAADSMTLTVAPAD